MLHLGSVGETLAMEFCLQREIVHVPHEAVFSGHWEIVDDSHVEEFCLHSSCGRFEAGFARCWLIADGVCEVASSAHLESGRVQLHALDHASDYRWP